MTTGKRVGIRYRSMGAGTSPSDGLASLTKLFKGDQINAEEVLARPGSLLKWVNSEAEARLLMADLQRLGIFCDLEKNPEPVDAPRPRSEATLASLVHYVTCPKCRTQQVETDVCVLCGMVFRHLQPSGSPEDSPHSHPIASTDEPRYSRFWLAAAVVLLTLGLGLGKDRIGGYLRMGGGAPVAVGRVVDTTGIVMAASATGSERQLDNGSSLYEGDNIRTDAKSRVRFVFSDRSVYSLKNDTAFRLERFQFDREKPQKDSVVFSLAKGGFRFLSGLIGTRSAQTVLYNTPATTIGIRGTQAEVVCANASCSQTQVSVLQGQVSVQSQTGTLLKTLNEGQAAAFDWNAKTRQVSTTPMAMPVLMTQALQDVTVSAASDAIAGKSPCAVVPYDPEAGVNPYAERLKCLGVDVKALSKAQGYPDGIPPDKAQEILRKTPGASGLIKNVTGDEP